MLTILANAVRPIAAMATIPILANELGVEGRGHLAAVTAPVLLVIAAGGLGLPEGAIFFLAKAETDRPRLFRRLQLLAAIPGLISVAILLAASQWLSDGNEHLQVRIICAAAVVPIALWTSVRRAAAIAVSAWQAVRREQIVISTLTLASVVVLALTHLLNLDTAIASSLGGQIAGSLAYRKQPLPLTDGRNMPSTGDMLSYSSRSWIGAVAGIALTRLDQSLMTNLSTASELGLYAVAVSVAEISLLISSVISVMAFSDDASSPSDERLAAMSRVSTTACLVLAATTAAFAPTAFDVLLPAGFHGAALPVAILGITAAGGIPGSIAGSSLAARGRPGLRSIGLIFAASINVVAVVVLVPSYGAVGAAVATSLATLAAVAWAIGALRFCFAVSPLSLLGFRRSDALLVRRTLHDMKQMATSLRD